MLVILNYDGQWVNLPMCLVWAHIQTNIDVIWDSISLGDIVYFGY